MQGNSGRERSRKTPTRYVTRTLLHTESFRPNRTSTLSCRAACSPVWGWMGPPNPVQQENRFVPWIVPVKSRCGLFPENTHMLKLLSHVRTVSLSSRILGFWNMYCGVCWLKALSWGNLNKTKNECYTAVLHYANINDFINPSNKYKGLFIFTLWKVVSNGKLTKSKNSWSHVMLVVF